MQVRKNSRVRTVFASEQLVQTHRLRGITCWQKSAEVRGRSAENGNDAPNAAEHVRQPVQQRAQADGTRMTRRQAAEQAEKVRVVKSSRDSGANRAQDGVRGGNNETSLEVLKQAQHCVAIFKYGSAQVVVHVLWST